MRVKKGIQAAATDFRGQGVDERVPGQASAGVGATRLLYHIIRLSGERGLGIVLEKPWKKLNWRVGRRGARAPAVARLHPGHEPKVGARLRLRQRAKM